jgi:nitrite reductase/ring-hydroxylating ferredoxin subunit
LAYRRVARVDDVPEGRGLCVQIDGIDVGLFRVEGELHAIENRCPHAGDPLSEGTLDGSIITCQAHGWSFDVRTGFRPQDPDGFPIPRFAVRVAARHVEVDLEQPLNLPPLRRRPAAPRPGSRRAR